MFTRMDALALGALIAVMARREGGIRVLRRAWLPMLAGGSLTILALLVIRKGRLWAYDPAVQYAGFLAFAAMSTGLTFGLAYASWHLYEKQFLKLKRYFEHR